VGPAELVGEPTRIAPRAFTFTGRSAGLQAFHQRQGAGVVAELGDRLDRHLRATGCC